jgi:hypothetical protein
MGTKEGKDNQNKWWRNRKKSMKFFRADNRVKIWRFSNDSGTKSVPIFRVCWWFSRTRNSTTAPWRRGRSSWNVGKPSRIDKDVSPRKFHLILSPWKLRGLNRGKDCSGHAINIVDVTSIGYVCIKPTSLRHSNIFVACRH